MGDAPARQERSVFGPWTGVNELAGELKDTDLEAAWNVELDGDCIVGRGGRKRLNTASLSFPTRAILHYVSGSGSYWQDVTDILTDGRADTSAVLSSLQTTGALYLSFASPNFGVVIDVLNANDVTADMVLRINTPTGWRALSAAEFVDGTESWGGATLAATGTVASVRLDDWAPGGFDEPVGTEVPTTLASQDEYWLRISFSATLGSSVSISAIRGLPFFLLESGPMRPHVNGLFQWQLGTGERLLLVGADDMTSNVARLFIYSRGASMFRPLKIPAGLTTSGPDARWSFAAMPRALVACNGYTTIYLTVDDPCTPRLFAAQEFVYPDTVQQQVPSGAQRFAIHFNGCIHLASGNRVVFSRPPSDVLNLKSIANAPLLGNDVFYAEDYFDVFDAAGGPITGWVTSGSSLLIFTALATFIYDGVTLTCLDPEVGCIAPGSLAATADAVYFLGVRGVYRHSGGVNTLISERIAPTLASLNRVALSGAVGAVYHARAQYRLFVASGDNPANDLGLIYAIEQNAWTFFGVHRLLKGLVNEQPYEVSAICSARDGEWSEELLTADYQGQLYLEDYGYWDDSAGVPKLLVFGPVKWDNPKVATLRYVRLNVRSEAKDAGLVMSLFHDDEPWERRSGGRFASPVEKTLTLMDPEADVGAERNFTDDGSWGACVWRSPRFVQKKGSFGVTARSFQLMLFSTSQYGNFRLRGLTYDLQPRNSERNEP